MIICCKLVTFFLNFLLKNTLCHLLESLYGGHSHGMLHCVVSWKRYRMENISHTNIRLSFLSEPRLTCAYDSVLKI